MTGQEIANNLKNSKELWGRGSLMHRRKWIYKEIKFGKVEREKVALKKPFFCVLGLKAYEAGVTLEELDWVTNLRKPSTRSIYDSVPGIYAVYKINDECSTKEQVIKAFESPENANEDFPVEKFIENIKDIIKKERGQQSNVKPSKD
jgi:hypothetical protein